MVKRNAEKMTKSNFAIAVIACVKVYARATNDTILTYLIDNDNTLVRKYAKAVTDSYFNCDKKEVLPFWETTLTLLIQKATEEVINKLQLYIQTNDLKALEQYLYTDDVVAFENGQHDEYFW